jgi:hypothetical protein
MSTVVPPKGNWFTLPIANTMLGRNLQLGLRFRLQRLIPACVLLIGARPAPVQEPSCDCR